MKAFRESSQWKLSVNLIYWLGDYFLNWKMRIHFVPNPEAAVNLSHQHMKNFHINLGKRSATELSVNYVHSIFFLHHHAKSLFIPFIALCLRFASHTQFANISIKASFEWRREKGSKPGPLIRMMEQHFFFFLSLHRDDEELFTTDEPKFSPNTNAQRGAWSTKGCDDDDGVCASPNSSPTFNARLVLLSRRKKRNARESFYLIFVCSPFAL